MKQSTPGSAVPLAMLDKKIFRTILAFESFLAVLFQYAFFQI